MEPASAACRSDALPTEQRGDRTVRLEDVTSPTQLYPLGDRTTRLEGVTSPTQLCTRSDRTARLEGVTSPKQFYPLW